MPQNPSPVWDRFDGLSSNDLILRLARDSDYAFVQSLVCDPSTVAATNDTLESAQTTLRKIWDEGLKSPDLRHLIGLSQHPENRIGYLRLLYPFEFHQCLWMSFLAVVPELRGRGWGRKILELLLVGARRNPLVEKFGMHTVSGNVHAVRLYESLGFECVKREPWETRDGTKEERLTLVQDWAGDRLTGIE